MDIPAKPWPTGLSEQCEPLVRRVLAPNASPYTFTGTQTYIVGAGSEVAVIDPGPEDEAHFEALLTPRGYFRPQARAEATKRTLRGLLTKPGWNANEIRTLRGVLSTLERGAKAESD